MRLVGLLAGVAGTLVLASACSGGGGTPPSENRAPEANFELPPCIINVLCDFTSTSIDDVGVTEWSWDFDGDRKADANRAQASFRYTAAADYDVSLTVRDGQGLSNTKTKTITIAADNTPPTAGFDYSCNASTCSFTSTSSDVAPGSIATYLWSFGDGGTADVVNPSHTYMVTASTAFTVTLTVTDNQGASDVATQTISVSPPPNTPPTAGFIYRCDATNCTFTSTSTDVAPGTIVTYAWIFGDGGSAGVMNPLHNYVITAPREFTVTLTVTDNEGATDSETQTISVSPPPPTAEGCTTDDTQVDCALNVTARSTMKVKLIAINCDLRRQRVTTAAPIWDQVFLEVCTRTAGEELGIFGGPEDHLIVFEPGSQVPIRISQGIPDRDNPVLGPPAARLEGAFPDWTIHFEDGANPGAPGEPDFVDLVIGVHATLVP
jgi:PKD repeat protein